MKIKRKSALFEFTYRKSGHGGNTDVFLVRSAGHSVKTTVLKGEAALQIAENYYVIGGVASRRDKNDSLKGESDNNIQRYPSMPKICILV